MNIAPESLTTAGRRGDPPAIGLTYTLRGTHSAFLEAISQFLMPYGLSLPRYTILRLLSDEEAKRLPMSALSKSTNASTANITKLVEGLERAGLVERIMSQADRRVIYAQLTDEGEAAVDRARPPLVRFTADLWEDFSEEDMEVLSQLLIRFQSKIKAHLQETSSAKSRSTAIAALSEKL